MSITSRQRVQATINHQIPDRVPIVIGVSNATGIKINTYRKLRDRLGIQSADEYLYDWPELGTAQPDEAGMLRLMSDVRGVLDLEAAETRERNRQRPAGSPCIDSWGTGQVEIEPGVWFPGVHPLAEVSDVKALEDYPWPDMNDPTRVAHVAAQAAALAAENRFAIMGTPWLLFPFERAMALQGMDVFLMNLVLKPEFAEALLWKIGELCKTLMGHFLDAVGENIDIIKIGDDLGSQEGLLISPLSYRQMLKPVHADLIRSIRSRSAAKVFFHSDGDVFDLIEDFIEIGVDILNPIQTSAGRMSDLGRLKARYDGRMVFCGGIDTHQILPKGSPEEVRLEVRRVIETLGPGGGYMLGAVHTIMDDVPPENVLAMVDAVEDFGRYPLGR